MEVILLHSQRPITDLNHGRKVRTQGIPGISEGGYRKHPYEIGHPVASQPLVDIKSHPYGIAGDNYYYRDSNTTYGGRVEGSTPLLLMREEVAFRLADVNDRLRIRGLELYVHDAWRPLAVQQNAREIFEDSLRKQNPAWSDAQVIGIVNKYWAVPPNSYDEIDPYSPPPHMTGAVADLTVRVVSTGEWLHTGNIFDDLTARANPDHYERVVGSKRAAGVMVNADELLAQENRREIFWTFEDPSLPNEDKFRVNRTEIWHVSLWDQLWARYSSSKDELVKARYPLIVATV